MNKQKQLSLAAIADQFSITAADSVQNQELTKAYYKLSNRLKRLLPIEKAFEYDLQEKLADMRTDVADCNFPRIDMTFLSMRRQQDLTFPRRQKWSPGRNMWVEDDAQNTYKALVPRFAIFTPDTDTCSFKTQLKYEYWPYGGGPFMKFDVSGQCIDYVLNYQLVEKLMNKKPFSQKEGVLFNSSNVKFCVKVPEDFEKVKRSLKKGGTDFLHAVMLEVNYLHEYHQHQMSCICEPEFTFSTQFTGVLPDDILDNLPQWQQLFHEVFFVAEAADWAVSAPPLPQFNADPLVIGRIGLDFWLLSRFDLTSAEEYVSREWTTK
ncbi:MAG: hypothetical protein K2Y22_05905 [Candidatus Obscuribacterales bacterium]|nr:hypothetical protein [Candidatus Obscuribacterales bacterium]